MSLCFVYCLSITGNSAGLALTKLQNDHAKISVGWFPGAGLWIVVSTCSKSSSFLSVILHRAVFISIFPGI